MAMNDVMGTKPTAADRLAKRAVGKPAEARAAPTNAMRAVPRAAPGMGQVAPPPTPGTGQVASPAAPASPRAAQPWWRQRGRAPGVNTPRAGAGVPRRQQAPGRPDVGATMERIRARRATRPGAVRPGAVGLGGERRRRW